jgi:hypothetical protein
MHKTSRVPCARALTKAFPLAVRGGMLLGLCMYSGGIVDNSQADMHAHTMPTAWEMMSESCPESSGGEECHVAGEGEVEANGRRRT